MPLIIESNDLFSRLKMIDRLRRFPVTKLLFLPSATRPLLTREWRKSVGTSGRFSPRVMSGAGEGWKCDIQKTLLGKIAIFYSLFALVSLGMFDY